MYVHQSGVLALALIIFSSGFPPNFGRFPCLLHVSVFGLLKGSRATIGSNTISSALLTATNLHRPILAALFILMVSLSRPALDGDNFWRT
jgi:hypothetical protein